MHGTWQKQIGLILGATSLLLMASASNAALPPDAQNNDDLQVMIAFIQEHRNVNSGLRLIDVENLSVHWREYGNEDCVAYFAREAIKQEEGMVGPLPPLVFDHATCPVE